MNAKDESMNPAENRSQSVPGDLSNALPDVLPAVARRRIWLSVLLTLVVFVSGLVVGVGGTLIAVRHEMLRVVHNPQEAPARIAAHLRSKLGLSDEQTRQVEAVVARRQAALQAIRHLVQPQVEAELDQAANEIGQILNESQRQDWDAMVAKIRQNWLPTQP